MPAIGSAAGEDVMTTRIRARRMAPEERRDQILDSAVRLIVTNGHSSCTLEQVAAEAGVSKPLIYKYFPRREDLLKAVLERELKELRGRGLDTIPRDIPLERIVRRTIERALAYYDERGPVLRLLSGDPAVADVVQKNNRDLRTSTMNYFIKRSMETYNIPEDVARIAVTMVHNAPIYSTPTFRKRGIPIERTADVWNTFIEAGWKAVEARFGQKPADARTSAAKKAKRASGTPTRAKRKS